MLATTVITAAMANTQPNVTSNFFISPELLMQLAVEEYDCLYAGNTNHHVKAEIFVERSLSIRLYAHSK